jgi:hypothetical protein
MRLYLVKYLILFCALLFNSTAAKCQNLVPNPSFEFYSQCPFSINQIHFATGWSSFRETPEYFNSCNAGNFSMPCNARGCQHAATGNGYASLYNFSTAVDFREYIGIQLSSPLVIGQTYYLSFKTSLSDFFGNSCATSKIGILLSTVSYDYLNPAPIENFAHVFSQNIISDSVNWTVIYGEIIADSNYTHVCIGNFFDNSNIDTLNCSGANYVFNYYVDDVCVSLDSLNCLDFNGVNNYFSFKEFEIYPNPIKDELKINTFIQEEFEMKIIDLTHKMIFSKSFVKNTKVNLSFLVPGIYLIQLTSKHLTNTFKLLKL